MPRLDEVYRQAQDAPSKFKHRRVLWIGSESYTAPAICVLQGLDKLGFDIYTIDKPNINSWFCNRVISDTSSVTFDFILSSLHWGTRWSLYDKFSLHGYPKVLIDGDDTREGQVTWKDKYDFWVNEYGYADDSKDAVLQTRRWMEPLGDYQPDVVFTMQRRAEDTESYYIPSGIHSQYLAIGEGDVGLEDRHIDFAHIPGPGVWRTAMSDLLALGTFPGTVHRTPVRGEPIYPGPIKALAKGDAENIHSYHRWATWPDFYHILNHSKVLIHPGIDHHPFWDCKRPYEGLACGCVVAMSVPCTDVSDYPVMEVCPEAVFANHAELIRMALLWHDDPETLEGIRQKCHRRGLKFFTPQPVARYLLHKVWEAERGRFSG